MMLDITLDSPLLDELRKLQENRESGVLLLSRAGLRMSVSYLEGTIQSASLNGENHRLGRFLARAGLLANDADISKVLAEARKKKILFGEAAVNKNYLDSRELGEAVRMQAIELLQDAFRNSFATESFTRG